MNSIGSIKTNYKNKIHMFGREKNYNVPILIAIVGHRDPKPEYIPQIIQQFEESIRTIQSNIPDSPLWLMTGLAEGADQIAAKTFLEIIENDKYHNNFHKLVSVLPKSEVEYIQDFESKSSRENYEYLLRKSDIIISPETNNLLKGDLPVIIPSPDCYARQTCFLIRYCYVLIAFSNGVENNEIGGTAQSIMIQRGKVPSAFQSVDEIVATREPGALIEINTPRFKNTYFGHSRLPITYWLEDKQMKSLDDLLEIPRHIKHINRDINRKIASLEEEVDKSDQLQQILDQRAIECKSKYFMRTNWLLIFGFIISLSLAEPPWQSFGLLFLAFAIWRYPKLQLDIKQKFIANRAATEVLNVQKLWRYVGVNIDASNLLRIGAERRIRWVTTLLRAITLVDCVEPLSDYYEQEDDDYISHWLTEKANWLEGEVKKLDLSRRNFYIRISFSYFIAALGLLVVNFSRIFFQYHF